MAGIKSLLSNICPCFKEKGAGDEVVHLTTVEHRDPPLPGQESQRSVISSTHLKEMDEARSRYIESMQRAKIASLSHRSLGGKQYSRISQNSQNEGSPPHQQSISISHTSMKPTPAIRHHSQVPQSGSPVPGSRASILPGDSARSHPRRSVFDSTEAVCPPPSPQSMSVYSRQQFSSHSPGAEAPRSPISPRHSTSPRMISSGIPAPPGGMPPLPGLPTQSY